MKFITKKLIPILLIAVIIATSIPLTSSAAGEKYFNVTKNCPIRTGAGEKYSTIGKVSKGSVVTAVSQKMNIYGNIWYKVKWGNDRTGYIWSGNTTAHKHSYKQQTYKGITFKTCKNNCTSIVVLKSTSVKVSYANSLAAIAPTAGTIALADGPIPVGDVVAVAFTAIAYYLVTNKQMTTSKAKEIVTETDFSDYLKTRKNVCSDDSFRFVLRKNGNLYYQGSTCLDLMEAYISARYLNRDVYTKYEPNAAKLAAMHVAACANENTRGSFYSEIDKKQPGYFHHYHLKVNGQKLPAHIFYGKSPNGRTPI